jgi:hypothetical protein
MCARTGRRGNEWLVVGRGIGVWVALVVLVSPATGNPRKETSTPISAGEYRVLPLHKDYDTDPEYRRGMSKVRSVLLGTNNDPQAMEQARSALKWGYLPQWTKRNRLQDLPALRMELVDRLLRNSRDQEAHNAVNGFVLPYMIWFAAPASAGKKCFHPAVRYNAMMVVGSLNSLEANNKRPAQPLLAALEPMLAAIEDPNQIDAVKVAAPIGIQRHAEAGMPAASRDLTLQQVMPLIRQHETPAGRSKSGHRWMQRQAIEIAGSLRSPGQSGVVVAELNRVLSDGDLSLGLRISAAEGLGKMPPAAFRQLKTDPSKVAGAIGQLAIQSASASVEWLQTQMSEIPIDEEYDSSGGSVDVTEMISEFELFHAQLARRKLKGRLHRLKTGLVGPDEKSGIRAVPAPTAEKAAIDDVIAGIDRLLAVVDTDGITAAEFRVGVIREVSKLERSARLTRR